MLFLRVSTRYHWKVDIIIPFEPPCRKNEFLLSWQEKDMSFNCRKTIGDEKLGIFAYQHIFVFFMFLLEMPVAKAQQVSNNQQDEYPNTKFSPQMAIVIVIMIVALCFMGGFSIYIRYCSDTASGNSVRALRATVVGQSRRAALGLDESVLNTFPILEYSEVKEHKIGKGALECAVCLSEFQGDETLRLIPKCDHVFHPDCIDEWLASHTTCPVCRANLVPQPGESVYGVKELETEPDVEAQHPTEQPQEDPNEEAEDRWIIQVPEPEGNELMNLSRNRTSGGSRSNRLRKFSRSHTTGHSVVQPDENPDRFTLRLPVEMRNQILNRELQRASSSVGMPREGSTRRGYRTGDDGSSRGKYSRRFDKSDRRVLSKSVSFFMRVSSSMKTSKVATTCE